VTEPTISFVKRVGARFPGLAPLLAEHTKDNFGQILPHVFLGELTRYTLSLLATADSGRNVPAARELRELLDVLEHTFASGDQKMRELIVASFLENLPRPGEQGSQIRTMLGTELSRQLRELG
jgi:hypothetical protein